MITVYKNEEGDWVPWTGQPINDVQYVTSAVSKYTSAELAEIGLHRIEDNPPTLLFYQELVGKSIVDDQGVPKVEYDVTTIPLQDAKARLIDIVDEQRWQHSHGGFLFDFGAPYGTVLLPSDRGMRTDIQGARDLLAEDPETTSIEWFMGKEVSVTLSAAQIDALRVALGRHVQACFNHQKTLVAAINASTTIAELASIDIETGWPNGNV